MACELPVIASTAGALPEVVGNDGAALQVPPRDARAIAQAVLRLIDKPDLRERMGKAARQRVLQLFTWENAAREMEKVYREAIDAHR
jgi:glycosyltransferase involved in cell wall biosynthesis